MAGRWFAGSTGQLKSLGVAGCVYFLMWVIPMMFAYYGQIDSAITGHPAPAMPPAWQSTVEQHMLVLAWLWSGITRHQFDAIRHADQRPVVCRPTPRTWHPWRKPA